MALHDPRCRGAATAAGAAARPAQHRAPACRGRPRGRRAPLSADGPAAWRLARRPARDRRPRHRPRSGLARPVPCPAGRTDLDCRLPGRALDHPHHRAAGRTAGPPRALPPAAPSQLHGRRGRDPGPAAGLPRLDRRGPVHRRQRRPAGPSYPRRGRRPA